MDNRTKLPDFEKGMVIFMNQKKFMFSLFDVKSDKPRTLKGSLVLFVLGCWIVPIVLFLIFSLGFYRKAYVEKNHRLIQNTVENTSYLVSTKIDENIHLLQKPSYEREWERSWSSMKKQGMSENEFLRVIKSSLQSKYSIDKRFNTYVFYLEGYDEPKCYSSRIGYSYKDYLKNVDEKITSLRKADNNYVQLKIYNNRLYILRNLYTVADYQKYGTLVVELNTDALFDEFLMEHPENIAISIDENENLLFNGSNRYVENLHEKRLYDKLIMSMNLTGNNESVVVEDGLYMGYGYQRKADNYKLAILYPAKKSDIFASLYQLYGILGIFVLLLIPFIILTVGFLHVQVEEPVKKLVVLSKRISKGNMGITEEARMPNQEMQYLISSMNDMSTQIHHLFNSVYNEKLLRKDAQIMALQAQINPHFLNNTLEIMNWQARMAEDVTVSRMIEALGTVLDHSMNRENQKEIYLSEELRCVDAYLYIMSMRFGQRLEIERQVDDSLLWIRVPQLILQPLIENAILHGIERVKSGKITIHVHHDGCFTYLDVINTGKEISVEKVEGIQRILEDANMIPEGSGKHTSIGIRNVNNRIKLVYGESYGLKVSLLPDKRFLSRILIPYLCQEESEENKKTSLDKE